jgi:uncharacterized protein YlaI
MADDGKVTCAGCGKRVTLDDTTTVGTQKPIQHHSCQRMREAIHQWAIALLTDPTAEQPATTK